MHRRPRQPFKKIRSQCLRHEVTQVEVGWHILSMKTPTSSVTLKFRGFDTLGETVVCGGGSDSSRYRSGSASGSGSSSSPYRPYGTLQDRIQRLLGISSFGSMSDSGGGSSSSFDPVVDWDAHLRVAGGIGADLSSYPTTPSKPLTEKQKEDKTGPGRARANQVRGRARCKPGK